MANTYTQIYLHVVFAVSARVCVIVPSRKEELQKYITGIVTKQGQKLIAIYCMPDHVHILIGLNPDIAPSNLVRDIKAGSTNHVNEQKWIGCRFSWQEGFGAFSVSHSNLSRVARYIQNQELHHRKKSFHTEYLDFLNRHHVAFESKYIFKPIE
ncbi:MAG TPA: IS200/IS605 family transposase [Chthoniobacteraceae bacterium]|nr:IS200/IS605 family transposase [Chthoniobacteraceae bacterium]